MPTSFSYRLIVLIPAARYATVFAWFQANIDSTDDGSGWPQLNPSGLLADAESHRWSSMALVDANFKAIAFKICQLASVTPPSLATWNGWTRAQKKSWLAGVRDQLRTNTGIWLALSDNDGDWGDPEAELTALALKRREAAP